MNICVLATASRESGALSIYNQFVAALKTEVGTDRYFVFIDPSMPRAEIEGVEYAACDTRGWRRIRFDAYGCRRELKKAGFAPDVIVSFQNVAVACTGVRQIIYFHNLLPVSNRLWNPLCRSGRTLFFYSSLYPHYVRHYLRRDMQVVVQAHFIKELFVRKFSFPSAQVHVLRPNIACKPNTTVEKTAAVPDTYNFLYPAGAYKYKRFDLLAETAAKLRTLSPETAAKLRIHLTLSPESAKLYLAKAARYGCEDMFVTHGSMAHNKLIALLESCDGLLFPSELETLGVPLLEAASCGLPIVVSDLPYAHETLQDYEGAIFTNPADCETWAAEIVKICNNKPKFKLYNSENKSPWSELFKLIRNENQQ